MATSSNSSRPSVSPHRLSHCTPIEEGNEDEEISQGQTSFRASSPSENVSNNRNPTPLHQNSSHGISEDTSKKKNKQVSGSSCGVSCNNCRPTSKGKILMVPADNRESLTSPNGLFKSIFSSLVKKSPGLCNVQSPAPVAKEEQWKIAAAELSQKLIKARRNRDEAVLEISRLKISITELEKKLNKLEIYCQNLKSGLELCNTESQLPKSALLDVNYQIVKIGDQTTVIENFLVSVSEARSSVKLLSRALFFLLKQMGGKVFDKLSLLLQPYGEKTSSLPRNNRDLFLYFEALFNRVFYEDFESAGFQKSAPTRILNPIDRCEANMASFHRLKRLTWDEVLTKGTKHFSEEFSKFCDRKMSEIVSMLGWNRAWPEKLLQSFFIASKDVWLVHLLANSIHPSLPIFRVDKGSGFDSVYMEDIGGEKVRNLVPSIVGIMVAPGFYVYDNVVKCKVVCRYHNIMGNGISKASIQPSESNHQIVVHDPMVSNARSPSEGIQESPVLSNIG